MSLLSWIDSADHLESFAFWFDVSGAAVELGVAITAAIIVHKEFGHAREKHLEKYVAIFAGIAAFLVLSTALANHRISILRGREARAKDMEVEKAQNAASSALARASKLEAKVQPRTINSEHKEAIIGRLKAIEQKQKIHIVASVLDAEAIRFAEDIEGVFSAAGFEVHFPRGIQGDASLMVGPPGLHIAVKDPKSPFPLAAKIQRSFMDSGIEMLGLASGNSQLETNGIEITVGQK